MDLDIAIGLDSTLIIYVRVGFDLIFYLNFNWIYPYGF